MQGYSIGVSLVLAIWAYIGIVLWLGPGFWFQEALVAGFVTGLVVGNVPLGLTVGATLTLISLGQWTYGGATIPDFQTGSIVGTAIGALSNNVGIGLAVAVPTALLMTQMDVLGRATTTIFIHGADHYANEGNERGITTMHLLGQIPWGLTRAIPVFLALWLGAGPIQSLINASPAWLITGITVAGKVLPALGFALLLSMLPLKKYWPFLLLGFIFFAYFSLPLTGIALLAVAIGFMYNKLQPRSATNV